MNRFPQYSGKKAPISDIHPIFKIFSGIQKIFPSEMQKIFPFPLHFIAIGDKIYQR